MHWEGDWEEPLIKIAKKQSQWGCFFVNFDEKFDNNNNFFHRNTGN